MHVHCPFAKIIRNIFFNKYRSAVSTEREHVVTCSPHYTENVFRRHINCSRVSFDLPVVRIIIMFVSVTVTYNTNNKNNKPVFND